MGNCVQRLAKPAYRRQALGVAFNRLLLGSGLLVFYSNL